MTKRKLLIALTSAAVATAAFGASVFPATAQQRVFQVTMTDGTVCEVTTTGGLPTVGCPGAVGVIESIN